MALVHFADSLWLAQAPMRALGLDLGTRMTVVRLPDGGLLLPARAAILTSAQAA